MRTRQTKTRQAVTLMFVSVMCLAVFVPAALADGGDRYHNTYRKDFIMDAAWRVIDETTAIPLTIILKDCDSDDIRDLHWIRCWDVTSGSVLLWDHDFGDETIGNDPYESNYWTYITTVTEGHPSLPNDTLLTPSNLGYGPGDAIQLKVSVYYRDDIFNYTESRYLRVHVGRGPFPRPDGWYGGDTHYHTMYTNNTAEFGAPLPAVVMSAKAMGLHWMTTSDHSCDLDETGDGAFSYATTHWEYTIQDQSGSNTVYRDNTTIGTTWDVLGDEVAMFDSPEFRLERAVELNAASVDGDSYQKTLHSLVMNEAYIDSPLSGALGERPVTPSLPDALAQITGTGFMYAAHPLSDMSAEWGGIDWTINGTVWGDEDYVTALGFEAFRGFQAFNTRPTRYSSDQNNPWSDFDAGVQPGDPYPNELLAGVATWDYYLRENLSPVRKIFFAGGSDAHGDLNYSSYLSLDSYATDNAMGKVQTVVRVAGAGHGPGNLPPMSELHAAYRAGRSVVTDGPFIEIGIDRNEDGDFDDEGDVGIGGDASGSAAESWPLTVRWISNADFGEIVSVQLLVGDGSSTTTFHSLDPCATGEGYAGERTVELSSYGFDGQRYVRAECLTDRGDDEFRAYTNPIWLFFDTTSVTEAEIPARLSLALRSNPFCGSADVILTLPSAGDATLDVFDIAGRRVVTLRHLGSDAGTSCVTWDGRNESGRRVGPGVYFLRLTHDGRSVTAKGVLLR